MSPKKRTLKSRNQIDWPREKMARYGPKRLDRGELLAILIGKGTREKDALELADEIIAEFKEPSRVGLLEDDALERLRNKKGIGDAKALTILAGIELGANLQQQKAEVYAPIRSAEDVYRLCTDIANQRQEHLVCLYLNVRNVMLERSVVTKGSLDKSIFHPREVFSRAVELRAANIILVHNHPSGNPQPSSADRGVSERTVGAGRIMGIKLLDFIIVTKSGYYSQLKSSPGGSIEDTVGEYQAEDKDGQTLSDLMFDKDDYKYWQYPTVREDD